jgi:tRNA dimethylallyltransferase
VGKTAVAQATMEVLRERGEDPVAISADALQVYRGLEVLTGAHPGDRLVGILPVSESFSAGEYAGLAHEEIDAALESGRRPVVVGGTGLYLQAALTDLELRPPPPPGVRERIDARVDAEGAAALHEELRARSPEAAAQVSAGDRTRLVRALELLEMGHDPAPAGEGSRLWTARLRHPTLLCGLTMEREALYRAIDVRVEEMLAAGAEEEVRRADAAGASRTARAALGFEELLEGDAEAMARNTRRLAKRQLTWLRRLDPELLIDVTGRGPEDSAQELLSYLR